ncbi:hypothetical protein L1285_16680 [Pseudoalteromonas sp. DL2-H2.2]|uniref:hypothetical protein n=1 Tax=Pseudoalteromonas sp. DL2-H2.2 TaxID=2908889 RepID=UPI001F36256F|nr:hypothetical protein [Pseudoalteromonas sp. DL2-H2.2]MCF2909959.1 hypothetical protein [Pseudoalteromonas sp. DL2-H2.2]
MSKKQQRASVLAKFHNLFVNQPRNAGGGVTLDKVQVDGLVKNTEVLLKLDGYSVINTGGSES